jgi:N-dimethylarginine dimethylaminohydrolase
MLAPPDAARVAAQHDALGETYRRLGVAVHYVDPACQPPPNQMFAADLFFMTAEGAIVGRPASAVRAGEERWVAARLAALGFPILRTVCGSATFEGADAIWLDPDTVLVGVGLRTNREGARQVAATLADIGVRTIHVELPYGTMHLMGQLRIVDRDLAFVWPGRISTAAVGALRERGYEVRHFPDEAEARGGFAHNFVTVGPREIVMPGGNPVSERGYRAAGITCHVVDVDEIAKAAGSIGCLTGVLQREVEPRG